LLDPVVFGPVMGQYIMTKAWSRGKMFTSWQPESKKRKEGAGV
jgi:hypothetical protein